jgi:hypothetical protein
MALLPCSSTFDKDPEKARKSQNDDEGNRLQRRDFGARDYLSEMQIVSLALMIDCFVET